MPPTTSAALLNGPPSPLWVGPPSTRGELLPLVHDVAWGGFAACLVGGVVAAATMAWKDRRGCVASLKGLGVALLGTVLIGAAGAILGSVT